MINFCPSCKKNLWHKKMNIDDEENQHHLECTGCLKANKTMKVFNSKPIESYKRFRESLKALAENLPDEIEDTPYSDYLIWHLEELLEIIADKIESAKK